jgi:uncharacterized protein (DUF2267 family)
MPAEEIERAAQATLETLSERLSWGLASELATELPDQLRVWLYGGNDNSEPFHADEFIRRQAARENCDLATAQAHARIVFIALSRLVRRPDFDEIVRHLPNDYRPLLH